MSAVSISVMIIESTSQTVRNVDGNSVIEESIDDREQNDFYLEVQHNPKVLHNPNHSYLFAFIIHRPKI